VVGIRLQDGGTKFGAGGEAQGVNGEIRDRGIDGDILPTRAFVNAANGMRR
jgi:hypothetical protein